MLLVTYNVIGAIVIPGLAFGALALMPFLDTTPERRPSKRPLPVAIMLIKFSFYRLFNLGICRRNELGSS